MQSLASAISAAALWQGLAECSSEGLVLHDAHGTVVANNARAEQLLGLSAGQLRGLSSMDPRWQAIRPDGSPLPGEQHPVMRSLRDGKAVDGELLAVQASGLGRRWLRVSSRPLRNGAGDLTGAVVSFADATDQMMLRDAPFGFHELDAAGCVMTINDTELAWLGLPRDHVLGRPMAQFLSDQSRAVFAESFPRLRQGDETLEVEVQLRHSGGAVRRVQVSARAVRDAEGVFVRTQSVLFDVTELRLLQAQAQSQLREQHAMLDNDLVGIVRLRDRSVTWANRAMHRMFGYEAGDMLGRSAREIYPDDQAFAALGERAYPVLRAGGSHRERLPLRRRDGSEVWCDLSGVMLDGATDETLWLMVDITEAQREHERVEHLALHDGLTGLPNRQLLGARIEQALAQRQREGGFVAVCYLDLDGFKPVNDSHGHAAGDRLLKEVARRLQVAVRPGDTVSRVGGDEFVILLAGLHAEDQVGHVVDRVMSQLSQAVDLGDGIVASLSASVGVSVAPTDATQKGPLMRLADQAMYRAKQAGRSRWLRALADNPP